MELLLYVAAFYLWQCVRFVPAGGTAFVSMLWSRPAALRGPGFRPLSPWSRHGGQEVPEASQRLEFLSALRNHLLSLPEQLDGEPLPLGEHRRRDPTAESYCPLCLADFRAGPAVCLDCGVDSVPYA